jgi:hypothetical protein
MSISRIFIIEDNRGLHHIYDVGKNSHSHDLTSLNPNFH